VKENYHHYRAEYKKESFFQRKHSGETITSLDNPFLGEYRDQVVRLLLAKNLIEKPCKLEHLHEALLDKDAIHYDMDFGVSQVTKEFYDTDEEFIDFYHQFLAEAVYPYFGVDFYFQKTPTFRFHFPNAKNSTHYPRWHTDVNYGHPPKEINILVPITINKTLGLKVMDLNHSRKVMEKVNYDFQLLRAASHEYEGEFTRMCDSLNPVEYHNCESMILFDTRCFHTALARDQEDPSTRVSIDVRIHPKEEYKKNNRVYQGLGRKKVEYTTGNAYNEQSIQELRGI
jgi:hypothetical protein